MILPKMAQGLGLARSVLYFLESLPLTMVSRFVAHPDMPQPTPEQIRILWQHIYRLHENEARNIAEGLYPVSALELENPLHHARSLVEVLSDGVRVAWRMRKKQTKSFDPKLKELKEELPEYYQRNFHFQTDGYLSEASARRYDHQVEILFSGTAGAMRRMILPILKRYTSGEGRWLEVGCGAGSATRAVMETFPKAKVTALDLSSPYLKVAQDKLRHYPRVDFVQGDSTAMDFKDQAFDAVYSVYVLHELPREEREKLIREAYRVLKPGGLLLIADSLQQDDEPELNWALERFPKVYHEPFYKNYTLDKLEDLLKRVTGQEAGVQHALFTKLAWVLKP